MVTVLAWIIAEPAMFAARQTEGYEYPHWEREVQHVTEK